MRSLFLRKSSKKAASKYRAVNEEEDQHEDHEDEIPFQDFGFEVRDDFGPRSMAMSYSLNRDPRGMATDAMVENTFAQQRNEEAFFASDSRFFPETPGNEYTHEADLVGAHDDASDECSATTEVQSVTSLYYDDHSESGNRRVDQQIIQPRSSDGSMNSQLENPPVIIENTRSVESSFPDDPTRWLDSPSTTEEMTRDQELPDDDDLPLTDGSFIGSVEPMDLIETFAAGKGFVASGQDSCVHQVQEITDTERTDSIYVITDMHPIVGDPSMHSLWISHDSSSIQGYASTNDISALPKLLSTDSEDATSSALMLTEAVFPDDPFENNQAPVEILSLAPKQDGNDITSEAESSQAILGYTDSPMQSNAEVKHFNLEEIASFTVVDVEGSPSPMRESHDTIQARDEVMPEEDTKGEVQSKDECKVINKISDHSLSEHLRTDSDDSSSGCYLEDDEIQLKQSTQDNVEVKEDFSALQPAHLELLLPLSDDPTRNNGECRRCVVLEEEIMILKAQYRTDMLERDIQDEDILRNMVLMKEYIDHLESSDISAPRSEPNESKVKSELEQRLQKFDEEIERVIIDCPPQPALQLDRGIADKTSEEPTTAVKDDERHERDEGRQELLLQQLEEKNKELLAALAEANTEAKKEHTMFKERLADLQLENSLLLEELKRTKHQLCLVKAEEDEKRQEEDSNLLPKDATDEEFRNRIRELEEERELLYIKIDSQEAAVALMNVDEKEMKEEVQALKQTLHEFMDNSEATGQSESKAESEQDKLIKRLREQLEDSQKLRRSQGDTISKLVQQVAELNITTKSADVLSTINGSTKEEIAEKIRALEAERNRWRAKSIVQERTIAKIQLTSGAFPVPAIEEGTELYPSSEMSKIQHFGSSSRDDDSSVESIYEETDDGVDNLSRKRSSGVFQ